MFQDGSDGEPTVHRTCFPEGKSPCRRTSAGRTDDGRSPPDNAGALAAGAADDGPHRGGRVADHIKPFHIRPRRIAGPHPLPSRQFQALVDSLFKVLFILPSRYLFAIGLSPVFSLGRSLPPALGCIRKQPDSPTAPRGAANTEPDGALTLPGTPFQGTWARSAAEDASTDYNSGGGGPPDSHAGLIPVRSPLLGESS